MIWIVTYIRKGKLAFCHNYYTGSARCKNKYEAERTVKENESRADRPALTIRQFKNMGEACKWVTAQNDAVDPKPAPAAVQTIDITPTWEELLPLLVEVAANGATLQGRLEAMGELRKLAKVVDRINAGNKAKVA